VGVKCIAGDENESAESLAMTVDHRALGVGYSNRTWDLIDANDRTQEQDRQMLASALASRQHWHEAGGADESLAVAEAGFDAFAAEARTLLAKVDDEDDRKLIEGQLASIPPIG
jgi:hypothetical protein